MHSQFVFLSDLMNILDKVMAYCSSHATTMRIFKNNDSRLSDMLSWRWNRLLKLIQTKSTICMILHNLWKDACNSSYTTSLIVVNM